MKKILIILFSIIVSLGLAFTITWGVINFNKVKDGMSGTGLYTETDLNKAHTDGYNQGIKDKAQYLVLIEEYRNTIAMLNDTVSQLTFQVNTLSSTNKDYETKIESLTAKKIALENEVAELELDKENNEATIYKLNNQIISLNKQISDLSNLTQTASSQITALTNRVNELQSSVNYYESFIAQMENGEQVVATYEVDGTVWKIEILNKGTEITFTSPANTETTIFNGWQIDGTEELLGNTYTINANTKFVADITYKHQVTFMVDEQVYDTQLVFENEFATVPETPTKDGYVFMGWALNRVDVIEDINTSAVTSTTIYYAVFNEMTNWAITSFYGLDSFYGSCIWTDGENYYYSNRSDQYLLDIETNTWSSIQWNVDSIYGPYIWSDGENYYYSNNSEQYVFSKETKTWTSITWNGLTNFYGNDIWTDGENYYCVTRKFNNDYTMTCLSYILNKETKTWTSITWNGSAEISSGSDILFDGVDCYYFPSFDTSGLSYKLNKENHEWVELESELDKGYYITSGCWWFYDNNVYYSCENRHYVLDKTTDTWSTKVWTGIEHLEKFYGYNVWECNGVFYYSHGTDHYVLRK